MQVCMKQKKQNPDSPRSKWFTPSTTGNKCRRVGTHIGSYYL